ncbi:hypothetical protein DBR06_SOUSAS6810057 [Sousa chinensis]|uniref:Uncharacterized protein n=1 Tax=Sousa chinensis TaxID=103600 RepID=A0A484H4E3_SOUCH|nr:hypothetical protein DBR06_SOUSAS6810057 [Sousa chinensis]
MLLEDSAHLRINVVSCLEASQKSLGVTLVSPDPEWPCAQHLNPRDILIMYRRAAVFQVVPVLAHLVLLPSPILFRENFLGKHEAM